MDTKKKIMLEALELFACHGYIGVSIRDIATKVGIKESSIYYHFENKRAIWDSIIEELKDVYRKEISFETCEKGISRICDAIVFGDEIIVYIEKFLYMHMHNEFVGKCIQMIKLAQFGNKDMESLYKQMFFDKPMKLFTIIFSRLIQQGNMVERDLKLMSVEFYAPFYYIIQQKLCSVEEALTIMSMHISNFRANYIVS